MNCFFQVNDWTVSFGNFTTNFSVLRLCENKTEKHTLNIYSMFDVWWTAGDMFLIMCNWISLNVDTGLQLKEFHIFTYLYVWYTASLGRIFIQLVCSLSLDFSVFFFILIFFSLCLDSFSLCIFILNSIKQR